LADPDGIEKVIQLNVLAVARLAAAAASAFSVRKSGTIINLASVLGLAPEMALSIYPGTKAFALVLSQELHAELSASGIRIQAVLPGATRTEIWERSGKDVADLPAEIIMEVDEMVDAALVGLDQGELVTIPSLPDAADWQAFEAARHKLSPNLSRNRAAQRYKTANAA
jgi:hypothetical protein